MTGRARRGGQALAVPAESVSPVSAASGFDPSRGRRAEQLLRLIVRACHSHIDGRDLMAEIHPRRSLDIKRRVDGRETWHEGDWLSDLSREIDRAKAFLMSADIADHFGQRNAIATEARRAETTGSVHVGAGPKDIAQKDQSQ